MALPLRANTTRPEWRTLQALNRDKDLVILKAYKGNATYYWTEETTMGISWIYWMTRHIVGFRKIVQEGLSLWGKASERNTQA